MSGKPLPTYFNGKLRRGLPNIRYSLCTVCGGRFVKIKNERTCPRSRCKLAVTVASVSKTGAVGYYVYGWYREGDVLPFYIGKGHGERAWRFGRKYGPIDVRVYRDGMTENEAYLVESVLIDVMRIAGAPLINVKPGRRRGSVKVPKNPLFR